jgi:signal transduction histidine kinase
MNLFRSLTARLLLAFVVICLIEALIIAFSVRFTTEYAFDRLIRGEAAQQFIYLARRHYVLQGSWDNLEQSLQTFEPSTPLLKMPQATAFPSQLPPPQSSNTYPIRPFALADQQGKVIRQNADFPLNKQLSPDVLSEGLAIEWDGKTIGTVLLPLQKIPLRRQDFAYLSQTQQALWTGLGGGLLVALLLGWWFVRRYMKPIHRLTDAIHGFAQSPQPTMLPVTTNDELGQLTTDFNKMSERIAHVNHLRRQMLADIAHELNTPLSVITGYLESLSEGVLKPTPDRLKMMYAESVHLTRLVQDLRTLSLADARELPLHKEPVDIRALIEQHIQKFQDQANAQNVALTSHLEGKLPLIQGDSGRISQVLENLISNALKYTEAGDRISIGAKEQANMLQIEVEDSGKGISEEALPHIFERVFRDKNAGFIPAGGSGLGLAITKALIEAHGGSIEARSALGEGTTILLELPI